MKMDEELQKRNTDCVYFLASPLTCKKGLDCEYRHNEMARLNPRDCWYWLAGNCVNPSCGFRHPPLDGHAAEAPPESEPSEPVNKTSIPCYFFFNGFCRKGSRCSFLHGPDGSASAAKSLMTVSENDDALPFGNKTSTGNDASSAPSEIHLNGSETASKVAVIEQKEAPVGSSLLSSNSHQSAFALVSQSDGQEATMFSSNPVIPAEGFVKPKSHLCTELNSEEETDDRTGPEERLESSPGFDVLVDNDNRSENLGYEDDPEYLLAIGRKQRELNSCFLAYDYEKSVEYDPMYPKTRHIHDYNLLDDEHAIFNARKSRDHSRERMLDSLLSRKRKLLSMEMEVNEHSGLDLRNYLRKRRVVDDRGSQERPRNHSMGLRVPRFTSQVEKSYMEPHERNRTFSNVPHQRERYRNSLSSGYREHYKGKRFAEQRPNSNEGSRKHVSRERRSSQISPTFTRPKTLAEIKEEKKKMEQNGDSFGKTEHLSRRSADFEGPKPLTVILKGKRRLDSTVEKQY